MDSTIFSFVDSVAQMLPMNSASLLASLDRPLWSSFGETHNEKRVDHKLHNGAQREKMCILPLTIAMTCPNNRQTEL
ncbi:hypothetical protein L596_010381 [Steinernema carpocapsae]|uniref:Uncharacterized protein n=1 Tax=Steinernema carpocapsae TaxID=34508 RepID=A0A4U5PI53_STECR|nr:hypothetical protein L596_010381 [Steinernema carpocapsae]